MTFKDYNKWKRKWYCTVPRCTQFVCCHEMTLCGVDHLCGDSTIYPTWNYYQDVHIFKETCTDVGCEDCLRNHDCPIRGKHENNK